MRILQKVTLFLSVLLSGCIHTYYVSNVQNVPLFLEQNELRLSGSLGLGSRSISTGLQAAFSPTSNIGVMANFMSAKGVEESDNSWGKGNYIDGAIGYYKPFSKSGVFEIYGGFGGSSQRHKYRNERIDSHPDINDGGTASLSFIKLFIQPDIGFTFNHFDFVFSTRFNRISFNKVNYQIDKTLSDEYQTLNSIKLQKNYLLVEPALTIRGGWENLKVQVQASKISRPNFNVSYFDGFNISVGLYGTLMFQD